MKILPEAKEVWSWHKIKAQTHDLQLWTWPWIGMVELLDLHTRSLTRTFDQGLLKTLPVVKEILKEHELQILYSWPLIVTLIVSQHGWVISSEHHPTEANIWPKLNEYSSGDKESVHNNFPWLVEHLQDILSHNEFPGSLVCKKASLTEYPACYSNLKRALHMLLENV